MAKVRVTIKEMRGKALLLKKLPINKVGRVIIPEGKSGQRCRLEVLQIGPEVEGISVGDFVIVSPVAQMVQFNLWQSDEIIIMDADTGVLAIADYEDSLIEVAEHHDENGNARIVVPGGN